MKKVIFFALVVGVVFTTSCKKDEISPVYNPGKVIGGGEQASTSVNINGTSYAFNKVSYTGSADSVAAQYTFQSSQNSINTLAISLTQAISGDNLIHADDSFSLTVNNIQYSAIPEETYFTATKGENDALTGYFSGNFVKEAKDTVYITASFIANK